MTRKRSALAIFLEAEFRECPRPDTMADHWHEWEDANWERIASNARKADIESRKQAFEAGWAAVAYDDWINTEAAWEDYLSRQPGEGA